MAKVIKNCCKLKQDALSKTTATIVTNQSNIFYNSVISDSGNAAVQPEAEGRTGTQTENGFLLGTEASSMDWTSSAIKISSLTRLRVL